MTCTSSTDQLKARVNTTASALFCVQAATHTKPWPAGETNDNTVEPMREGSG